MNAMPIRPARQADAVVRRWLARALVPAALLLGAGAGQAETREVSFPWQPGVHDRFSDAAPTGDLTARLHLPDGASGPLPFIVFLHGCSGLRPQLVEHWSSRLNRQGVGVLMVDSFTARGISDVCGEGGPWFGRRVDDVRAAHAWLVQQPFVRTDRIALMGQSHGGAVTLLAMAGVRTSPLFVGGVALYPACQVGAGRLQFGKPTVIMVGDEDNWTPAAACQTLHAAQKQPEHLDLIVYPGARHSFDNPVPYALALRKYYVGEHAASRDKARERVAAFVEAVLKP
ncbi:dienelactone hydrolase family protein [Aquabacterium sp. J223]|uniref:dienelactone hydrolase family protein n=1 Tax=Aquabacterium sp. J223 TaxID=2898431 RepID=UPI0021AD6A42|nr:dienelactone hydrolase family protein [Aquabacterium sp. J223]UUX95438.1 dienelactone hydrolase family protein [Aquabacterium sp. J223]